MSTREESHTTTPRREFELIALRAQLVEIDPGREHVGLAVVHDAHHQERRLALRLVAAVRDDHRQTEDVPVALLLVDVGLAQREDAVGQHALGIGVDDAGLEAVLVVLRGRHLIEAVVGEELRPILERIAVDAADIGRLHRDDAVERDLAHRQTPIRPR